VCYGYRVRLAPSGESNRVVTAGLAESNGSLYRWVYGLVIYTVTACTPGSALGITLNNECDMTLPFFQAVYSIYPILQYFLVGFVRI